MKTWRDYMGAPSAPPVVFQNQNPPEVGAKYAKPPQMGCGGVVSHILHTVSKGSEGGFSEAIKPLESVLKGKAVELWAAGDRVWLVADEADAVRLREPRGQVYTAAEARMLCRIQDPGIVREVHAWRRTFDARLSEFHRPPKPGVNQPRRARR